MDVTLLIEQAIPTKLMNLNSKGLPDTFYIGINGDTFGTEIKQAGEVLGSLSNVEEQLSRESSQVDTLSLTISGIIVPDNSGGCRILSFYPDGSGGRLSGIRNGLAFKQSYAGYRSWIESVERWGIRVVEVPTKLALATHLISSYQYDQKPASEHHTFTKPLRQKQLMPQFSPAMLTLMGLINPATGRSFCGNQMAEGLLATGLSVIEILSADCDWLANVQLPSKRKLGLSAAKKILAAVGRE